MELYNQELGDPGKMPVSLLIIFILSLVLTVGAFAVIVLKNSKKPIAQRIPSYAEPIAYAALFLCLPMTLVCFVTMVYPCWWQGC